VQERIIEACVADKSFKKSILAGWRLSCVERVKVKQMEKMETRPYDEKTVDRYRQAIFLHRIEDFHREFYRIHYAGKRRIYNGGN
jgi:hypothetical protein